MKTSPKPHDAECKHNWKIDEFFESGAVMLFAGKIGEVKQEMRYICSKCRGVKYD